MNKAVAHLMVAVLWFGGAGAQIGAAADLLVASFGASKIVRYDAVDGSLVGDFVSPGGGGLSQPHHLLYGPDGHLYVASFGNGAVMRYDGKSGVPLPSVSGAAGTAQFVVPGSAGLSQTAGLGFGPDGHLYVSSLAGGSIRRYDGTTGAFIDVFVAAGSGGLAGAEILEFGEDGHLYIASLNNAAVMRYDGTTGAPLPGPAGAAGTAQFVIPLSGGLTQPHGLTFGPDGHLYVASFGTSGLKRYDGTTGAFLSNFGPGPTSAHGLRFGADGNLYGVGFGFTGVLAFEPDGTPLGAFVASGVGGLSSPADVLFMPETSACLGDFDETGDIGFTDLLVILAAWGPCGPDCFQDLDTSGDVGFTDLLIVLAGWGPCRS